MQLRLSTQEEIYQLFSDRAWNFFTNHIAFDLTGVAARSKVSPLNKSDDKESQQNIVLDIGRWHKIEKTTFEQIWFRMAQDCHQHAKHIGAGNSPLDVSSQIGNKSIGYDIKCVKESSPGKKTNEMSLSQNFEDDLDDIFRIFNERIPSLAHLNFHDFEQDDIIQAINKTVNDRIARFTQKHGKETRDKYNIDNICMPVLVQDFDGLGYSLIMLETDHLSPLAGGTLDIAKLYENTKSAMFNSKGAEHTNRKELKTFPITLACGIGATTNKEVLDMVLYKSKKRIELRIQMDKISDAYKLRINVNSNPLLKIVSHNNLKEYSYSEFVRHIADQTSLSEKNGHPIVYVQKPVSLLPQARKVLK